MYLTTQQYKDYTACFIGWQRMEHVGTYTFSKEESKAVLLFKEVVPSTTSALNSKLATTTKELRSNRICRLLIKNLRDQEAEEIKGMMK